MRRIALIAVLLASSAVVATAQGAGTGSGNLTLVAYSTPREAYGKIIPEFQKTTPGKGVGFEQSYGASGEQARAVAAGLRADLVALSLEPDVKFLVGKKLVPAGWKASTTHGGIVHRSVVVFVLRRGNPKKIKDWGDLIKPGVQVVTPNVQTSGGAKWNIMAAYGAQIRKGKSHAQAVAYLRQLYSHVVSQDKSAREALQTFLAGRGDVLLAYENEAIFAQKHGQDVPFVIPKATLRIENPIAVTTAGAKKPAAKAFVKYLFSAKAQRTFAENGFRPVLKSATKGFSFPVRPQLFTIAWLGGWNKVDPRFFGAKTGIVTKIQRQANGG
jgi:sulfate transport system substrate-binding protein